MMREDWIEVELGGICKKITDGTHKTPKYTNDGIHFISVKDIRNQQIDFSNTKFISQEEHDELIKRCHPEEGDILITKSGTIGRLAIVPKAIFSLFVSVALLKIDKHIIDSKYCLYNIENHINYLDIDKQIKGGLLKNYHLEDLRKAKIPLAPLPEQRAIAAKIEQLFSELDNGIANLKAAKSKLEIYRQAILKKAFEGNLTKDWRKKQTNLSTKEELLDKIQQEYKQYKKKEQLIILTDKDNDDNDTPASWCLLNINCFLSLHKKGMTTGPFGTMLSKKDHKKEGVPVLGIENIGEGFFKMPNKIFVSLEKASELKSFEVDFGDIIISRSGTVGEICAITKNVGKALISTNLIRISLNENIVKCKYFVYLFLGGRVREQVKSLCAGSTRDFLNQTILNSIEFPIPSIEEQNQIVQEIETRLSVCDKLNEAIDQSLEKAQALRQSILKKAFEGKLLSQDEIQNCRQQPDWEPAAKLLERVKKDSKTMKS